MGLTVYLQAEAIIEADCFGKDYVPFYDYQNPI